MLIVGHASNRGKVHATRLREGLWQQRTKKKVKLPTIFLTFYFQIFFYPRRNFNEYIGAKQRIA